MKIKYTFFIENPQTVKNSCLLTLYTLLTTKDVYLLEDGKVIYSTQVLMSLISLYLIWVLMWPLQPFLLKPAEIVLWNADLFVCLWLTTF